MLITVLDPYLAGLSWGLSLKQETAWILSRYHVTLQTCLFLLCNISTTIWISISSKFEIVYQQKWETYTHLSSWRQEVVVWRLVIVSQNFFSGLSLIPWPLIQCRLGFKFALPRISLLTFLLYNMFLCCCCYLVVRSCPTLLQPYGVYPARILCPWDFPGQNTGVGCRFLLQGIFPTQGSRLRLLHWQADLYHWATREAQYVCSNFFFLL